MWCRAGRCPHRGVGASPTTRRPCSRATRDFIRCVVIGSWVRGGGGGSRPGTPHHKRLPPLMQVAGAAAASTSQRGLLSSAAGGCSRHAASAAAPRSRSTRSGPLQTPIGSSRRSANLRRQHLRVERRRFARRSRAMRDEETTLDLDLKWGEGMSGRVVGPVWTRPAGLGGRALTAERDLSFYLFAQ